MRVVAVVPLYPPKSLVGAWISTHECLRALVARGHDVRVYKSIGPTTPYVIDEIPVASIPRSAVGWGDLMRSADVLVSHLGDNRAADRAAAKYKVPSVRMGHGGAIKPERCIGASLVVWNSEAFRRQIEWDGPSIVVHPPIWAEKYETTPGDLVTLVNCSKDKGVQTMWRAAQRLPHIDFLAVKGGYGTQIAPRAPNVEVVSATRDMRSIYGRTRVLLMPSQAETWGRTGVEAMASGIPVIAHPTPGLKESLSYAGIFVHRDDTEGWVRQIERLVSRPSTWKVASSVSRRRSAELDPTAELKEFVTAVERLVPVCV